MHFFRHRAMLPLWIVCLGAVVLATGPSSSAVALDWDARLRQSDRDVALFHSMEAKLKLSTANPAHIGSGGPSTPEAVAGGAGVAASRAPAPIAPGACRFPELLNHAVQ
jgi:hypothetical protein